MKNGALIRIFTKEKGVIPYRDMFVKGKGTGRHTDRKGGEQKNEA